MVRAVLDTNVLVAAVLSPKGKPAQILDMAADRAVELALSPAILAEYEEVLRRDKFGLAPATVTAIMVWIKKLAVELVPSEPIHACRDAGDDKFLECAVAAGVPYLITGNKKHYPELFREVQIISPAAFLSISL